MTWPLAPMTWMRSGLWSVLWRMSVAAIPDDRSPRASIRKTILNRRKFATQSQQLLRGLCHRKIVRAVGRGGFRSCRSFRCVEMAFRRGLLRRETLAETRTCRSGRAFLGHEIQMARQCRAAAVFAVPLEQANVDTLVDVNNGKRVPVPPDVLTSETLGIGCTEPQGRETTRTASGLRQWTCPCTYGGVILSAISDLNGSRCSKMNDSWDGDPSPG